MAYWTPQAGPQVEAVTCPADEIMFGGSRGGGKSDALIGRHIAGAELYAHHWNGLTIRRKYKDFAELRHRWDELIAEGLPAERVGGDSQTNYIRFANGAQVTMTAIGRLEQVNDYIGHQYPEISIDEAPMIPFFHQMIDKLKGSNRSPHGIPCHIFCTGNPGGPGHSAVKEYFRLGKGGMPPKKVFRDDTGATRVFIPSFLSDNKILCTNDPKYVQRLLSIRDPALKKAWISGDWDVFIGQAFSFSENVHVVPTLSIPDAAPLYMTYDWGWGAPFSIGWWWVDTNGDIYRFAEWYGWNGQPNEGLRLVDSEVAKGIVERERNMGISHRHIIRISGPDCFQRKPNYQGGGQGPSTAEVFAADGLMLNPGDATRTVKIRNFREYLAYEYNDDGTLKRKPKMYIYRSCHHFIRTIPALAVDEDNPEDIDTDQEDHVFDEACHVVQARPILPDIPRAVPTAAQEDWAKVTGQPLPGEEQGGIAFNLDEGDFDEDSYGDY